MYDIGLLKEKEQNKDSEKGPKDDNDKKDEDGQE